MEMFVFQCKRRSFQQQASTLPNELFLEWNISALQDTFQIQCEARFREEDFSWSVRRNAEEILALTPHLLPQASTEIENLENSLWNACQQSPEQVLQFVELSRWSFAFYSLYKQTYLQKIKEGSLEKATGGYESYYRSRNWVLFAQFICVLSSLFFWQLTNGYWVLYVGFSFISFLSLAHWLYYRLNAIDATCVIPCMFVPPIGPILVLAWAFMSSVWEVKKTRWFVLRSHHLEWYSSWTLDNDKSKSCTLLGVLLLDSSTSVKKSRLFPCQFVVCTPYRMLRLWASNQRERDEWVQLLETSLCGEEDSHGQGIPSSFAPLRENVPARFLVDGRESFVEIKRALLQAQKEIFIAGWMLSPELHLDRPRLKPDHHHKLPEDTDSLFQTKRPTIVVHEERYSCSTFPQEVYISAYEIVVKDKVARLHWTLEGKSQGSDWFVLDCRVQSFLERDEGEPIRFLFNARFVSQVSIRFHGNFAPDDIEAEIAMNWAHLYLPFACGGVCLFAENPPPWGRWFYSPIDWWHWWWGTRVSSEETAVLDGEKSRLDRILAQKVREGVSVYIILYRDLDLFLSNASHFAKQKLLGQNQGGGIQVLRHAPMGRAHGAIQHLFSCSHGNTWWSHHEKIVVCDQSVALIGGLDLAYGRFDDDQHELFDHTGRIWTGRDYFNVRERDFEHLGTDPYSDAINRAEVPRMPWHDVHCMVSGAAAGDVARHFVGRWNAEKREMKGSKYSVLVPRLHFEKQDVLPLRVNRCQVLRSVGLWSSPSKVESSILDGYLHLIQHSRSCIYIEQQFFSSSTAGEPVQNTIALALVNRIIKAHQEGTKFRVIVLLPIVPAFQGEVSQNSSSRSVLHWNLQTIRGMIRMLESEHVVVSERLGFYSLRKVQRNNVGVLFSEQIYIHSKLLIVDDEHVIIGSANLNDRSMLGTRDSELAVWIASKDFGLQLRKKLCLEHTAGATDDPFDFLWNQIACKNSLLVETAWREIPQNRRVFFATVVLSSLSARDDARESIRQGKMQGHLICFPLDYLSKEGNLLPSLLKRGEKEGALPLENFT